MARGWESKSVEAQMENAGVGRKAARANRRDPKTVEAMQKQQSLLLARARIAGELERTSNPRYAEMLKKALADVDGKLAQAEKPLEKPGSHR